MLWEQILSLKRRPHLERTTSYREANRKSQMLFPFVKMAEKHDGIQIYFDQLLLWEKKNDHRLVITKSPGPGCSKLTTSLVYFLLKFQT